MQGEHIGTKTCYTEAGTGWQYRFSRQIEIGSEVSCYRSLDAFVFNENLNSASPPNRNFAMTGATDMIILFRSRQTGCRPAR